MSESPTSAASTKPAPKKVKVKLLGPHTHAGVDYGAGDTIEVRESQAKALIEAQRATAA